MSRTCRCFIIALFLIFFLIVLRITRIKNDFDGVQVNESLMCYIIGWIIMVRRGVIETSTPEKTCFVICPIGDEGSPERKWSDDILECIITPVVEKMGYQKPIRADHINESGIITRQIVDLLIDSDLVIADLSFRNPNVCYELAVRHVAKKPFIHMIKTVTRFLSILLQIERLPLILIYEVRIRQWKNLNVIFCQ